MGNGGGPGDVMCGPRRGGWNPGDIMGMAKEAVAWPTAEACEGLRPIGAKKELERLAGVSGERPRPPTPFASLNWLCAAADRGK